MRSRSSRDRHPASPGLLLLPLLLSTLGLSCAGDGDPVDLLVDLQTDRLPGTEFVTVRTTTDGGSPVDLAVVAGDTRFVVGARAAEFEGLYPGIRTVEVTLLAADGSIVATGAERFDHQDDTAIVIQIASEACAEVTCPVAAIDIEDVCYRGRCVEPSCVDDGTCPEPECAVPTDCPVDCIRAECLGGVCSCYMDQGPGCDEVTCGENALCDARFRQPCVCVDGYEGDGFTCTNIDECATDTDGCDARATCTDTEGSYTCECPDGLIGDGTTCENACSDGTAGCHEAASCTLTESGAVCECLPGYSGDGVNCELPGVLVVVGCDLEKAPPDCTYADDAAQELGYRTQVARGDSASSGAIASEPWEVVVVEVFGDRIRTEFEYAWTDYINSGGKVIFRYYNMEQVYFAGPLSITAVDYSGWRPIHSSPAMGLDLFEQADSVPFPLDGTPWGIDSGHELTTVDPDGFIVARSNTLDGPGVIAITNESHAIANGFTPFEMGDNDLDGDSRPDALEIYANEIRYLAAPRVLVYADDASVRGLAEAAVIDAGYSVLRADAASLASIIAANGMDAVVALLGPSTPAGVPETLTGYVTGGGRLVISWPDLPSDSGAQTALGVSASAMSGSPDLVERTAFGPSFFSFVAQVPGPLAGLSAHTAITGVVPDAEERALFSDRDGAGAIVVSRGGRVIVNGFAFPAIASDPDADGDDVGDARELLRNQIHFIVR